MEVPHKILKAWNSKRSRGDVAKLVSQTKLSKPTIIKAINHGQASEKIILKICRFYSEKKILTPKEFETQALILLNGNDGQQSEKNIG